MPELFLLDDLILDVGECLALQFSQSPLLLPRYSAILCIFNLQFTDLLSQFIELLALPINSAIAGG